LWNKKFVQHFVESTEPLSVRPFRKAAELQACMQLTGLQWRPAKINKLSDGSLEESVFGTGLSTDVTKGILHGRTEFFAVSLQTLQHLLHKLVPGLGDNGATSEALKKLATWARASTRLHPAKITIGQYQRRCHMHRRC